MTKEDLIKAIQENVPDGAEIGIYDPSLWDVWTRLVVHPNPLPVTKPKRRAWKKGVCSVSTRAKGSMYVLAEESVSDSLSKMGF